ncbi:MAG: hypothetical protein IPJ77_18655 [Planctomycetes bacterium]|nr:hypothetical protein [Planctomycetota bacterium]
MDIARILPIVLPCIVAVGALGGSAHAVASSVPLAATPTALPPALAHADAASEPAARALAPEPGALPDETPAAQFAKKKDALRIQIGQRHLEYGLDLRKQGLPTQAAAQIVLAVETSDGKNPGANTVLSIMRQYDEAFWKRHGSRPSKTKLEAYGKRAAKLLFDDEKERLELANWGQVRKLEREAHDEYVELLRARNEPLAFDAKGQITLPSGAIPKAPSETLHAEAITINGVLWVRDELLEKLPEVTSIFQADSEELLVRSTVSLEVAQSIHALGSALLPILEEDVGARPEQRLVLYLFAERKTYEALLDALGHAEHKLVSGVAMNHPRLALACAEGLDERGTQALCLHELTHHDVQSVSRAVFPSWYSEAYADTFGGPGTFEWDGTKLVAGGLLPKERLERLRERDGARPIRALIETQALDAWRKGKESGFAFYAEAWAFLRYLRQGASEDVQRRFALWEDRCRGQVLGFEAGARRQGRGAAASELFLELFGKELHVLEDGFATWRTTL